MPVQGRTGVRNRKQDVRFEATITRPPLISDFYAPHVAKLKRQEIHATFYTDLVRNLGDPHLGASSVIWTHRLAVRMAIDQKSITLSGRSRFSPSYESLQNRGIGRVQVNVIVFSDFRKVGAA